MELTELEAVDLTARISRGDVSCVEVMTAALDRIDAVNDGLTAIVALGDRDALLAEARDADRDLSRNGPRGALHGLPIAVKDLSRARGFPTSMGSPLADTAPATADDLFVGRMRDAGALFIGKTNVPEFGLGSHSTNPVHGVTRNPWNRDLTAGGSSGGAAAALAAGMQWVCDGSDAMGSLRNPAGWCNVYGFRPTFGRVPGEPEGDVYLHPLSTAGPMARRVSDLAMLFDVLSGPDPRLPFSRAGASLAGALDADLTGRRIAWMGDWGGAWPLEPGIRDTCETALAVFRDLGCEVEEVAPPFPATELWDSWTTLRAFSVAARMGPLLDLPGGRAGLKPAVIEEVEMGRALTPADILRASAIRSRWFAAAYAFFGRFDAMVMPTAQCWPFPVEWDWPKEIAGRTMDRYHRWMECVIPASLLGLPALAVPAGFGPQGLPIGLQVVGRFGDDAGVLQLGQGWDRAADWTGRRPVL